MSDCWGWERSLHWRIARRSAVLKSEQDLELLDRFRVAGYCVGLPPAPDRKPEPLEGVRPMRRSVIAFLAGLACICAMGQTNPSAPPQKTTTASTASRAQGTNATKAPVKKT